MIKTSIGEVLSGAVVTKGDERIYFVRDNNFPIYIGQAIDVCDRIKQHCGFTSDSPDFLGRFVFDNQPESSNWQVDLLTLDECELLVRLHFLDMINFDVDIIERTLILDFGPCLNINHNKNNPKQHPIPDKYNVSKNISNQSGVQTSKTRGVTLKEQDLKNGSNVFLRYREQLSKKTISSQKTKFSRLEKYLSQQNYDVDAWELWKTPDEWSKMSADVINNFIDWEIEQAYSAGTINQSITALKRYAQFAFRVGIISDTHWLEIKKIKHFYGKEAKELNQNTAHRKGARRVGVKNSISTEQAVQLKNFPSNTRNNKRANLIMSLLLDHGLKKHEIATLNTEQFDIKTKVLFFERNNRNVEVQLTSDTVRAITELLKCPEVLVPGPLIMSIEKRSSERFTGERIKPDVLYYLVRKAGNKVGINKLNMQDCHAYWKKDVIKRGADLSVIQPNG